MAGPPCTATEVAESLGLPPIQAQLLYNRGVLRAQDVEPFIAADTRLLHDYSLLPDIDAAVERVTRAISVGETIGIYGDFDTDGISGTALLARALRELEGSILTYLPDRVDEGHGLNTSALDKLGEQGVTLLITVDCGVGAVYEVAHAQSLGMDTVITDHHAVTSPMPTTASVVNPAREESRYPSNDLTGCGTGVQAGRGGLGGRRACCASPALGAGRSRDRRRRCSADRRNRFIVGEGIRRMNRTELPGLKALIEVSGKTRERLARRHSPSA